MRFLLKISDHNFDQTQVNKINKIIVDYNYREKMSSLTAVQKNKIDIILTIYDFKYVIITLTYHYYALIKRNSDDQYNSKQDEDYDSSETDSSDNADDLDKVQNELQRLGESYLKKRTLSSESRMQQYNVSSKRILLLMNFSRVIIMQLESVDNLKTERVN